jgi:HK97 family phage major capsid protein
VNLIHILGLRAPTWRHLLASAAVLLVAYLLGGLDAAAGGLLLANAPGNVDQLLKAMDSIEERLKAWDAKADGELKTLGKVADDTKTAIHNMGLEQKGLAERLLQLEQRGAIQGQEGDESRKGEDSVAARFLKSVSGQLESFRANNMKGRVTAEVKNTVTNTVGNTDSARRPGIVGGAFRMLRLEAMLNSLPTTSPAIEFVREATFVNAAAETAEAAVKPESSVTTELKTVPMATVAHWLKISKQLAADNAMLAAYINTRMIYGVDLRVENQIISGNGTSPNMEGFSRAGNFTAHGYTAASLTALGLENKRFDLIGKMIGDAAVGDYPADAIMVNPGDWWTMRLTKDSQGRYLLGDPGASVAPMLWDVPVVASNAIAAGTVYVANLSQAATFYRREAVSVELSDSDGDNFTRNLITVRAERRCALAVERPAAIRFGQLVPA